MLASHQVELASSGLQSSLLVRHPDTGELFVNFDPSIWTLIRETECMLRLGLDIPIVAQALRVKRDQLKSDYNKLDVSLRNTGPQTNLQILSE